MAVKRQTKKRPLKNRYQYIKYFLIGLLVVIIATGIYLLRGGAFAAEDPDRRDLHGYYDGALATGHSDYTGADPNVVVKAQWGPEPSAAPWQIVVVATSNSKYVEYLGFSCNGFSTCRPSSIVPNDYFPEENHDLKVCINVPAGYSTDGMSRDLFTMHYRYLQPPPHLWFRVWFYTASGTCDANPTASGARQRNGHGNCSPQIYVAPGQYREEQCNFNGPGDGRGKGVGTGFSPAPAGEGPAQSGQAASPSSARGRAGGGGGSSATTLSDTPNSLPDSTPQGEQQQPEIEPSPFFDGKLFAAGSDKFADSDNTVSVGGFRLGYGWFYLAGALALVGVCGLLGWRYRSYLKTMQRSLRKLLHI
jgi:hypothetical protein